MEGVNEPPQPAAARPLYALAIFLNAFLLFAVQPLIGKFILPWFGGVAAVWTVCLLFFQVALLLGYYYAHLLVRCFRPRLQGRIHAALLAASLLLLPILPRGVWKPAGGEDPALHILLLLSCTIGLPYLLLSSTSPLLQAWYVQARAGQAPYRLYALSNAGSLLALLSYPLLIEPRLSISHQGAGWSLAYAVAALLCAFIALCAHRLAEVQPNRGEAPRRLKARSRRAQCRTGKPRPCGWRSPAAVALLRQHHGPRDREYRPGPAAVDHPAGAVSAQLHPVF